MSEEGQKRDLLGLGLTVQRPRTQEVPETPAGVTEQSPVSGLEMSMLQNGHSSPHKVQRRGWGVVQ